MTTGTSSPGAEADFRQLPLAEMEAIIARFEERVNAAQQGHVPTKELARKAIRRQGPGRCPVRIKRLSLDVVIRHGDALADLFCEYPDDVIAIIPYDITIGYQPPERRPRINPVQVLMHEARWIDEWGTGWGHAFGGVGATPVSYPLGDWAQLDEYLARRLPAARAPGRLDAARALLDRHRDRAYCFGVIHLSLFERLHSLRSMEKLLVDFYAHEQRVHRLLEAVCRYLLELIRCWAEIGADGVFLTDDWGSQTGLMISPAMWRAFFKPYYRRVFAQVHECGMDAIFHSCGQVTAIVEDLIEAGMDVLDPVQPGAMDVEEVSRAFGGRVSFCGAIDVQHLLCEGTPAQIRDETRRTVEVLGQRHGDGLIAGPANVITPEVPLENLRALFAACHEP